MRKSDLCKSSKIAAPSANCKSVKSSTAQKCVAINIRHEESTLGVDISAYQLKSLPTNIKSDDIDTVSKECLDARMKWNKN